jgi:SAM-dependent methyltransferase
VPRSTTPTGTYRDAFFALVPPPERLTLEVGSGEGRVSRDLAARGHRVTAVDITEALVRLAAGAASGPACVVADGAELPLRATSVDLADAGSFTAREAHAPFVIEGVYLSRRPYEGTFERGELRMTFKGWSYPLAPYSQALESEGFLVEALREPEPAADAPARLGRYRRIPNFLMLRAVKSAPSPADPTHASQPRRAA